MTCHAAGAALGDLLDQPSIAVGIGEGKERSVARVRGIRARKSCLQGERCAVPHVTRADATAGDFLDARLVMSETISAPTAVPGADPVTPLPKLTEQPEPGGVNWTIRTFFAGATSSSSLQPKC